MRAPLAKEPLAAWPTILDQLSQRQTVVGRLPGEDQDAFENRVGTALMALFRDTRDARCFEALYAFAGTGVLTWIRTLIAKEVRHLDPNEAKAYGLVDEVITGRAEVRRLPGRGFGFQA